MSSRVRHITFDSADPYQQASFWADVLNATVSDENQPGDSEALVEVGQGSALLFVRVPEPKSVKNRVHLDIQPVDCARDQEVNRILKMGGTVVADHRRPDGRGWVTMADPEGNEFCVELSKTERDHLVGSGTTD